jgi:hypothetical protein
MAKLVSSLIIMDIWHCVNIIICILESPSTGRIGYSQEIITKTHMKNQISPFRPTPAADGVVEFVSGTIPNL